MGIIINFEREYDFEKFCKECNKKTLCTYYQNQDEYKKTFIDCIHTSIQLSKYEIDFLLNGGIINNESNDR